ncbi:diguanylate cyclase [Campylobacter sp.]|uniref:diguanylate cyclase domain-containing protein n=1 Tax=Campylobacter sp. TaxID=205 RepID=UPI0025BCFB37|nr:diguanylate cyclase [Campylobacter sp.]
MILSYLPSLSFILEILALCLAYFFKQNKIFFLLLLILCARSLSLVASEYQVHLFISIFLPFSFVLFIFLQDSRLVFEKINFIKFAYIAFIGIVALILITNTNFNSYITSEIFGFYNNFFRPISEFSYCIFWVGFVFLLFLYFKNNDFYFLFAYVGLSVQFLFYNNTNLGYYEFASLVFIIFLIHKAYKIAFFDSVTNLPNLKALKRYSQGLENFHLVVIKLKNLNQIQNDKGCIMQEYVLHSFAKILKKTLHARIFKDERDYFIVIFEEESVAFVQSKLQMLENFMKKYIFEFNEESAKLEISVCLSNENTDIEKSIRQAKIELKK